jgi:hypothetical protein
MEYNKNEYWTENNPESYKADYELFGRLLITFWY